MAGSKDGGKKTAATNFKKYGPDYYKRIGALGGKAEYTKPRGFAAMSPEKRSEISKKGGRASVPKGMASLSPERRTEAAKKAWETRRG